MKKMIALLALAFFGMTATCGTTFAAEANNGMATANEQAVQDPAITSAKESSSRRKEAGKEKRSTCEHKAAEKSH